MATLDFYPALRLQRLGTVAVLQPVSEDKVPPPSLTVDLETGTLAVLEHAPISGPHTRCYGALGMLRLDAGPALVVITGVQAAGVLREQLLLRVTAVQVLADSGSAKWSKADRHLLRLLTAAVDPRKHGAGIYFAHAGDVTLTSQHAADLRADPDAASKTAWQRADPVFAWNAALAKPFLDAGMEVFCPPAFMGFVEELRGLAFLGGGRQVQMTVTLVARRSARRPGTRQWRRGIDADSNVANYVETEQVMTSEDGELLASFVQVRGSLPLLWAQTPCLAYKIPIRLAPTSRTAPLFKGHMDGLVAAHGGVTAISLANATGREGVLTTAYVAAAKAYSTTAPGLHMVPFDFHKICGATNYARLSVLWDAVAADFEKYGYFSTQGGVVVSRQRGVFRTNCIDTLDRTNVVQGMLARKALEHVLSGLGVLPPGGGAGLAAAYPDADRRFRVAWADHGDAISRQYAGTGAMKSAFTRTGKRDVWGLLDDGAKSLTRYYLNNFQDGEKQDALDLVTGVYAIRPGKEPRFRSQASPAMPLIAVAVAFFLAMSNLTGILRGAESFAAPDGGERTMSVVAMQLLQHVLILLVLSVAVLAFVFKNGRRFVNAPQLKPEAARPW